jgi:hypothetical protein
VDWVSILIFCCIFDLNKRIMAVQSSLRPLRRPVVIASYTAPAKVQAGVVPLSAVAAPAGRSVIRNNFPVAGESVEGGTSDGYCYRITFSAGRLEATYALIRAFLAEQGYADIPLPQNTEELRLFRLPPKLRRQLSLFGDNGYVHNPVKILFPVPAGRKGSLVLELYNEYLPDHLLRFHRIK